MQKFGKDTITTPAGVLNQLNGIYSKQKNEKPELMFKGAGHVLFTSLQTQPTTALSTLSAFKYRPCALLYMKHNTQHLF